ncbi:uncharacterized protein DS421_11g336290 [Arachis hypogaea]|nr:uncharacterized protein DS421_11g336290 [Arachis hypogaea]
MYKGRKDEENKAEAYNGVCVRTTTCAKAQKPQNHVCVHTTTCAYAQEENLHVCGRTHLCIRTRPSALLIYCKLLGVIFGPPGPNFGTF